jgi:hypothetical protein
MNNRTFPANSAEHTLYRWTDGNGDDWACAAYDHGAFCRLCTLVDPGLADKLAQVETGVAEVHTEADGSLTFTNRGAS